MIATDTISPSSPMRDVLAAFPGAQRALFRKYHIGGCSSCGFSPDETLADLCARNGGLNPDEVLAQIRASHEEDSGILIEPNELKAMREADPNVRLLDVRAREEFEAVHIDGAQLMSQPVVQQIMADGSNDRPLVIIDHQGKTCLDAAAYFIGHGLKNVRALRGGLDAWSQEVDPSVRRYKLG
jgi:rhodanese-related sulfurtransferase